ncbi:WEB family protein At5g16730, chloroplastic-like isoform X3 [Frieseomelitta varia]|uniref:WEB family protein At5g16730, chloroplastic-like isoform X3 n=1 Tax=Frieseomelitta varia TaxID=561572 RepID=UPI001CB686CD|nr:WEB family protein At5g16730, chloroplastic-like isoform X3 [Frieseomelitta varia]
MSRQCCFLCASDEGVFLDVTTDNKQQYYDQFEICSFVKIPRADQLPAKICHKCAYELNQCSSFVQKYIRAKKKQKPNVRKHCGLCCEPAKNEFIFDLSKEKKLQYNPFHKIQEIFDKEQIGNIQKNKFICLPCRYVIDVLIDLMNICEETAMRLEDTANKKTNLNKVDQLIFPKIKTAVVSRKTTTTDSARINLHTLHESTSDFGEMTRTRSRNNKLNEKTKLQVCNKCHSSIKTDDDMYKTQKTGKLDIVCKNCWKNMDIHKTEKQVQQNSTEIKLCTVFLKDVLKDIDIKEKKLYRIDEDDEGNDVGKQNQKRSVKSLKTADEDTSDGDVPNKKYKSDAKEVSETNLEQLNTNIQQQQTTATQHTKITQKRDTRDTDSRVTRRQGRTLTKYKRATGSSLSDADVDNKHNRKRLKTILSGIPIMKSIDVNDESSNEGVILKRKRSRYTSTSSTIEISDDDTNQKKGLEKNVRRKKTNIKKLIKSSAVTSQELQSLNSENIFETQTYVCDECGASYENKLTELTHKLTHYKQPELKLQKLNTEILTKTILGLSTVMDDQSEDLSETIAITVEDDEEELLENEIDLNINNHADTNDIENKIDSSKKEAVEDVVDVKLVMKEFDDDHKTEEKTEDLQKETKKEIEDLQKETEKDTENLQKETEKDTEDLQKEIEKDTEDLQKETEKKTEDLQKETEEETEDLQKQPEKETEDLQIESKEETEHSQEVTENLQETEKFTKKEIENLQIEEKETKDLHEVLEKNEIKEDKNEENEKEKNNFKIGERIHRSVDCLNSEQIIKILDNNDSENKQEEHKEKDIHENNEIKVEEKQIEIEVSEERETEKDGEKHINVEENKQDEVVCNGQQSQIVNQESSNKIDKDFVNNVPKKMEQSNIEHDRTRDETKVGVDDKDDITISTEQKSPKLTQKRKSFDENKIQTKINDSDFKKSEVLEENVLSKEDSTTDKQHVSVNVEIVESNSSKEEESTNDSITAAAEILQEVLDLASAKVEKRQEVLIDISTNIDSMETETLENISREIQNTVDM